MSFTTWLRNGKRSAPTARRRRQTSPRQRASFRPRLEALEDRLTPSATGYLQTNLTANPNTPQLQANHTDANLNGWGMTSLPNGQFCVSNTFANGTATFYAPSGAALPLSITVPVEANVSDVLGIDDQHGHPTGVVYNSTNHFVITNPDTGKSAPATLIFDTLDGIICGWNPAVDATHAIVMYDALADNNAPAVYTGLEMGQSNGQNVLYATDFLNDNLEIIGPQEAPDGRLTNFTPIPFANPDTGQTLSEFSGNPYARVWSVSALNDNQLVVTFADLGLSSFFPGDTQIGGGAVDVFNTGGGFQYQIATNDPTSTTSAGAHGVLENPWGVTVAPANFSQYSNDLLVGNVWGPGNINAFAPDQNGNYTINAGKLTQPDGTPIAIKGLWDMEFDHGGKLFFDAGPNHPGDPYGGLFGVIKPARPAKAAAIMSVSMMPTSTTPTSTTPTSTMPTSTTSSPNSVFEQPIDALFQEFDAVLSSLESNLTAIDPQLSGLFSMVNADLDALEASVLDRLDALETA